MTNGSIGRWSIGRDIPLMWVGSQTFGVVSGIGVPVTQLGSETFVQVTGISVIWSIGSIGLATVNVTKLATISKQFIHKCQLLLQN